MKKYPFMGELSDEERIFSASLEDKLTAAEMGKRGSFTFFLGEAKAELARKLLAAHMFDNYLFYGGYENAERQMLGIFCDYETPGAESFPITPLTFSYRSCDRLTHRDFLGALTSLGVERDTVGDILVAEGKTCVFLTPATAAEALALTKVGSVGVRVSEGYDESLAAERRFKEISGTVSSLRLDCIVALAAGCSRAEAARLISQERVCVKGRPAKSPSLKLCEGDGFTVRGYGRFIFDKIGRSTKKERTFIELRKFI